MKKYWKVRASSEAYATSVLSAGSTRTMSSRTGAGSGLLVPRGVSRALRSSCLSLSLWQCSGDQPQWADGQRFPLSSVSMCMGGCVNLQEAFFLSDSVCLCSCPLCASIRTRISQAVDPKVEILGVCGKP